MLSKGEILKGLFTVLTAGPCLPHRQLGVIIWTQAGQCMITFAFQKHRIDGLNSDDFMSDKTYSNPCDLKRSEILKF